MAGADTWTNTTGTAFHATGGNSTLTVTRLPGMGTNLTCTGSTATGTVPMDFTEVTGEITFSPCSVAGTAMHVNCHFRWTPDSISATVPAVTTGEATVTCVIATTTPQVALRHIEGSVPSHYINPNGATVGRLTLTATNTLTVTHSSHIPSTTCTARCWAGLAWASAT